MGDEKVIKLHVNRKDFEEIYFKGNQGSLFFSSETRSKTIITIVVALIFLITFSLKENLSKESFGILYFISFVFLLCAVYLSVSINKVSRWKKQVKRYLKSLENAGIYEIRFNNETFNVNLNEQHELSRWSEFVTAETHEDYISMEGKYNYMFPAKSMSEQDYSVLKQVIKKNIK
ncbi:hypothetical protein [Chryseobacterium sp. LAM-KRS1]|uniref:hypothetical protein n=1 Tax=Chryseobacterium sp. LAM-KRS1 TaxID=2715754 RepID=UPI0015562D71|nr:hypothetical protein [Chryseobacterium sp. LAM-KRS1]